MAKYLVTYDLKTSYNNDRSADYNNLYSRLNSLRSCVKLTESSCMVETVRNHVELRDYLMSVLNSNDSLFVGTISAPAAWNYCLSSDYQVNGFFNN